MEDRIQVTGKEGGQDTRYCNRTEETTGAGNISGRRTYSRGLERGQEKGRGTGGKADTINRSLGKTGSAGLLDTSSRTRRNIGYRKHYRREDRICR
jgi:hypothetical protein